MIRVSCVVSASFPGTDANSSPEAIARRDRISEHDRQDHDHAGHDQKRIDDEVAKSPGRIAPATLQGAGERRHEGRGHRPLRKQVTDEVGDAKGHVEGIHGRSRRGPEQTRQHHFADDAQEAARHSGDANRPGRAGQTRAHRFSRADVLRESQARMSRSAYHSRSDADVLNT